MHGTIPLLVRLHRCRSLMKSRCAACWLLRSGRSGLLVFCFIRFRLRKRAGRPLTTNATRCDAPLSREFPLRAPKKAFRKSFRIRIPSQTRETDENRNPEILLPLPQIGLGGLESRDCCHSAGRIRASPFSFTREPVTTPPSVPPFRGLGHVLRFRFILSCSSIQSTPTRRITVNANIFQALVRRHFSKTVIN